jgi:hypothetical protein
MKIIFSVVLLTLALFTNCDDNNDPETTANVIEFYLLNNYELENNGCKINENTAVIADTALLQYDDIKHYDKNNFVFKISEEATSKIFDHQSFSLHQKAFAVCADKEIIYTAYFWAAYSSLSCEWTVVDPVNYNGKNELRLSSVYPGYVIFENKHDDYNNQKILSVFRRDGKLIE